MRQPTDKEHTRKSIAAFAAWQFRNSHALPWLVLVVSLSATLFLWSNEQERATHELHAEFNFQVQEAMDRIAQRMQLYQPVLSGAQALFNTKSNVSRDEFHTYVVSQHLEASYPGIQGVGFTLIVPPAQKARHIAAVRKETFRVGRPAYDIWPEGERDIYTSVVYIEPFANRNLRAFGFDMYTDPVRRAAMEQARDTGRPSITGKVRLVQETDQDVQSGFLMYLPVYKHGSAPVTLAERRAGIVGWVFAPFRLNDLMQGIEAGRSNEFDTEIYDGEIISGNAMMYDHDLDHGLRKHADYEVIYPAYITGHRWTLRFRSLPVFEARLDKRRPMIVGLSGIAFSLLMALLTGLLARGQERAEKAARKMNKDLITSEERARLAISASNLAAWDYDMVTGRVYLSEGWSHLLGGEQLPTNTTIAELTALVPAEDQKMVKTAIKEAAKGLHSSAYQISHRVRKFDGSYMWILSTGRVTERDQNGWAVRMLGVNRDITERKQKEELMHQLAHYDALTGLPNRVLFSDRITQSLLKGKREKSCMAVMLLDLDKFKPVNDTFGHQVGDLLLKEVAKRLASCLRESDTVSRLGGDEFVLLLPTLRIGQDATLVAEKILRALSQTFELAGHAVNISASIGASIYPEHGDSELQLVKNADLAMYQSKLVGGNRMSLFQLGRPAVNQPT